MPFAVTKPPDVIEATLDVLLLHVPLEVASLKVIVPSRQSVTGVGVMAAGLASTVSVVVV